MTPIFSAATFFPTKIAYLICDFDPASMIPETISGIHIAFSDNQAEPYFIGLPPDADQTYFELRRSCEVYGKWSILGFISRAGMESMRATFVVFIVISLLAAVLFVVLLSVMISRSLLQPLRRLTASFEEIAAGRACVYHIPD